MHLITAPDKLEIHSPAIFLAGSIEQDKARKWQDVVIHQLQHTSLTILNPRRAAWDASWQQEKDFAPFHEQVTWELNALEAADIVLMYFDPKTKSPITLLEMGLFARSGKLMVCCPRGFWRKGNVDIDCDRFGITQTDTLEELIREVQNKLIDAP